MPALPRHHRGASKHVRSAGSRMTGNRTCAGLVAASALYRDAEPLPGPDGVRGTVCATVDGHQPGLVGDPAPSSEAPPSVVGCGAGCLAQLCVPRGTRLIPPPSGGVMGSTPRESEGRTLNNLTVTTQQHMDRTVVTVAGAIDLNSCPALEDATLVIPLDGKTLHLEMSGVSFMDSVGLNLLLKLRRRMLAEGGQLLVTGLQSQPASVLRLTETDTLLTAHAAQAA